MPCYSPNHCFNGGVKENGRVNVLWKAPAGTERLEIPCGKCVGCRLEYSRNMASRCVLEAKSHKANSFVTLTYDDKKLPVGFDGNVSIVDHQLFMKRLRKHYGSGVRFYMCAEYGGEFGRPHYHYLLFGLDFPDKEFLMERRGKMLYRSPQLEKIWPYGYSSVGSFDVESAAYVARYCMKKVGDHFEHFKDDETGFRMQVDKRSGDIKVAEFSQMSRGGRTGHGIGFRWFHDFSGDVFPSDELVISGKRNKPPRYFMNLLEKSDPQMFDDVKAVRRDNLPEWNESSDLRLRVKEQVKLAQIRSLTRSI